jgi:glutamate 5-kinase
MDAWAMAFDKHGLKVGQILLTRDDIDSRARFLNLRNTLNAMHELGAVPIINENDTVSTDEIVQVSFGDNDILASLVSQAIKANLLVLLSVVDGLLDGDGKSVRMVENIEEAQLLVRVEKSAMGRGGMDSKLQAARVVTESGDIMVVANGRMKSVLPRLLDGDEVGTLFVPATHKRIGRSRWIGAARPKGSIQVDAGAALAVAKKKRSLLPAGVTAVVGQFERGDLVGVEDSEGNEIARGLTNYSADLIGKIMGKKTAEVRQILGDAAYDEVIHRDNLVVEG